jgi:WD40 repeat protein
MSGLTGLPRPPARLSRRWQAQIGDHVISVAWSPCGALLAAAAAGGPITLFDAPTGKVRAGLPGHGFGTTALGWCASGLTLASAGQDGKVRLWDGDGKETAALDGGAVWVERLAWHPTRDLLATAAGRKLRLWGQEGRLVREYPDHTATVADVCWRPGTGELTSATYGGVTLWSPDRTEPVRRLEWKGSVLTLAWAPDGRHLAHGNQDATVHFWVLKTGRDLQMTGYPTKVRELAWDATGTFLATGGGEAVTVWDSSGKGPEGTTPLGLKGHRGPVSALAFQRRGPLLASGGQDGRVALWQPGKFRKALSQSDLGGGVTAVAWAPDDRGLAAAAEDGGVTVFGLA